MLLEEAYNFTYISGAECIKSANRSTSMKIKKNNSGCFGLSGLCRHYKQYCFLLK